MNRIERMYVDVDAVAVAVDAELYCDSDCEQYCSPCCDCCCNEKMKEMNKKKKSLLLKTNLFEAEISVFCALVGIRVLHLC
jgi:hypothetical protein